MGLVLDKTVSRWYMPGLSAQDMQLVKQNT